MSPRERFLMALEHKEADRIPMHDQPQPATIRRWRSEGLPADFNPSEYFDFEMVGFSADVSPRFPVKTVGETKNILPGPQNGEACAEMLRTTLVLPRS